MNRLAPLAVLLLTVCGSGPTTPVVTGTPPKAEFRSLTLYFCPDSAKNEADCVEPYNGTVLDVGRYYVLQAEWEGAPFFGAILNWPKDPTRACQQAPSGECFIRSEAYGPFSLDSATFRLPFLLATPAVSYRLVLYLLGPPPEYQTLGLREVRYDTR